MMSSKMELLFKDLVSATKKETVLQTAASNQNQGWRILKFEVCLFAIVTSGWIQLKKRKGKNVFRFAIGLTHAFFFSDGFVISVVRAS